MKLSASYNYFNGAEHLLASVRSIRDAVEYISVVYQLVSNAGHKMTGESLALIHDLVSSKMIDEVYLYEPNLQKTRRHNEAVKRKIGLNLARRNRCTHFFTIDADEFYREKEIIDAKKLIISEGINSTSVSTYFHIKRPIYRAFDTTCCAFITELNFCTRMSPYFYPHEHVDSTRKIFTFPRRHLHFDSDFVSMYHMNLVRSDLVSKFENTSTTDKLFLDDVANSLSQWSYGQPFLFGKKGAFDVDIVQNEFGTWDCYDDFSGI